MKILWKDAVTWPDWCGLCRGYVRAIVDGEIRVYVSEEFFGDDQAAFTWAECLVLALEHAGDNYQPGYGVLEEAPEPHPQDKCEVGR